MAAFGWHFAAVARQWLAVARLRVSRLLAAALPRRTLPRPATAGWATWPLLTAVCCKLLARPAGCQAAGVDFHWPRRC
eukprot:3691354-Alexandrium_andersonii.AAC.1